MICHVVFTEGPFQSDALLVPENCLFDHIHNQTRCWEFDRWNQTAAQSCQDRDLTLRSFAMLLPCGISLFSGVEFVCCPTKGWSSTSCRRIFLSRYIKNYPRGRIGKTLMVLLSVHKTWFTLHSWLQLYST